MGEIRVGTSGWSYPSGEGHVERHLLSGSPGLRSRGRGKFDELAFYAEHFDTVEINSTFYRMPAPATATSWANRTPRGLRVLAQAVSEVHPPGDVREGDRRRSVRASAQADVDEFRSAIDPLASARQARRAARAISRELQERLRIRAATSSGCWSAFREYPVAVELRHRSWSDDPAETLDAAASDSAPPGRRSTNRSSDSRSVRTCCRT